MDAAELDERIRRLEARHGFGEQAAWPDPNRLPAPQPWRDAVPLPTPLMIAAVADDNGLPPAA